jgi:hypothetical protein
VVQTGGVISNVGVEIGATAEGRAVANMTQGQGILTLDSVLSVGNYIRVKL